MIKAVQIYSTLLRLFTEAGDLCNNDFGKYKSKGNPAECESQVQKLQAEIEHWEESGRSRGQEIITYSTVNTANTG